MNNTGGPAFPTTKPLEHWGDPNQGMTLRDYFAAKAMAVYFQDPDIDDVLQLQDPVSIANWCYEMADEMLKARQT